MDELIVQTISRGVTREILPREENPFAKSRAAKELEHLIHCREIDTIDRRELPGRGFVRKIKAACSTCGAPAFYLVSDDCHSWATELPTCDTCVFVEVIRGDDSLPITDTGDHAAQELARFMSEWSHLGQVLAPLVAQMFPLTPHTGKFELGERTRPRTGPFGNAVWLEALARHAAGDHGDFGKSEGRKLTSDERWAPRLYGVAVRNAIAIEAGSGLVRSRLEIPDRFHEDLGGHHVVRSRSDNGHNPPRPGPVRQVLGRLDIATLLTRGGPARTHCRVGVVGEQAFRHDAT